MSEPIRSQQPNSGQQDKPNDQAPLEDRSEEANSGRHDRPTDPAPLEDRSEETEATPPQQQTTLHTRSTRPARLERRAYTVFTPYPLRGSVTQDWWDGDEESIEDLLADVLAGQPAAIETFTVLWEEEDDDDEE